MRRCALIVGALFVTLSVIPVARADEMARSLCVPDERGMLCTVENETAGEHSVCVTAKVTFPGGHVAVSDRVCTGTMAPHARVSLVAPITEADFVDKCIRLRSCRFTTDLGYGDVSDWLAEALGGLQSWWWVIFPITLAIGVWRVRRRMRRELDKGFVRSNHP